ncbi:hypothetical protein BJY16_007123 [Actinoplanes octamycinicus]|uniref:Uncharacterized protein n=1 Tax=Actinoplanes octamycinicus TaxID=135948 RepID=A0A7W7H477_9ACTN|nr:hypothetical protein [Actinoplanes octamycinicus]MBB4743664.1 hypothetical protein [Actinoplanes octamycinicus]GIE61090.1 hypothetical protein Aoc01nite_64920 [Actinoplanes octamycinicus]
MRSARFAQFSLPARRSVPGTPGRDLPPELRHAGCPAIRRSGNGGAVVAPRNSLRAPDAALPAPLCRTRCCSGRDRTRRKKADESAR